MADEFQESDIIFCEHDQHLGRNRSNSSYYIWPAQLQRKSYADGRRLRHNDNKNNKYQLSSPIGIPEHDHSDREEAWVGGGEVVPPHLILAMRVAAKMEFSVCSGKGRTLKGRDITVCGDTEMVSGLGSARFPSHLCLVVYIREYGNVWHNCCTPARLRVM